MGIERLTVLFPIKVSLFDLKVEKSCRKVQYKLDAHRAGANRLQKQNKN